MTLFEEIRQTYPMHKISEYIFIPKDEYFAKGFCMTIGKEYEAVKMKFDFNKMESIIFTRNNEGRTLAYMSSFGQLIKKENKEECDNS